MNESIRRIGILGGIIMYKKLSELVDKMNGHTVLEFAPHVVVFEMVENFFLKKFNTNDLLDFPINMLENQIRRIYLQSFPNADAELLENFSSEVVFYLTFRLSEQGKSGPIIKNILS